ncbi:MAG: hypothetical protein QXL57_02375 [Candidatus Bathyarchaeia archaeon]
MGLYEELCESFPLEDIHPYGFVLIVPKEVFRSEWESQLKSEGVQIYTNSYNNRVCFFLRKKNTNSQAEAKPAEQPKELKPIEWNEETLRIVEKLRGQGLGYRKISQKLEEMGFKVSHTALMKKLKERNGNGAVAPMLAHSKKLNPQNEDDSLFKEYLEASELLYPKYRKACAVLLREAAKQLENS